MAFSQKAFEGELFVDHRASPGLPAHVAIRAGYDPAETGEGKIFERATKYCSHCQARVILNPLRERDRATCLKCSNHYICDLCDAERRRPDYVHRSLKEVCELVASGDYVLGAGTTAVRPILIPVKEIRYG